MAFYDLGNLRQNEPGRANRVVSRIMDDTLRVVDELGQAVNRLRSKGKHRMAS